MPTTRTSLSIALILSLASALSGCHKGSNLSAPEHIQRAQDYAAKGDLKASIIELKNAIEKDPGSSQARLLLGQVYIKAGQPTAAESELNKAEKLGVSRETIKIPLGEALVMEGAYQKVLDDIQVGSQTSQINRARILQIRADALMGSGKIEDACNLYQQSLDTDSSNPPTYWGLARCAISHNDLGKARELLDTALKANSRKAETWIYIGGLARYNDDMQAALSAYGNAVKADPGSAEALVNRASAYLLLDQFDPAQKDIDALKKLAPGSVAINYLQALQSFKQAKYSQARDHLQQVFKLTENHAPSILLAGITYYELGSYQQAESYLNRYLARYPQSDFARRALAAVEIKEGSADSAVQTLTPLLTPDSKDVQALSLAGDAYLRLKDYSKSMLYLERAASLDPANLKVKTSIAVGHLAEGDRDKAITELTQVASIDKNPSQADLTLVILYLKDKNYDQAIQAIDAFETKLPNNPVTENLRAAALLGKHDLAGARKALEQALSMDPAFYPAAVNLAGLDLSENKPDEARKIFEKLLEKDKKNIQAMMALADLAQISKDDHTYVSWLQKAIKTQPDAIKPRATLVQYYLRNKQTEQAMALALDATNTYPNSLEALNLLGATQLSTGDTTNAVTTFTRMTQKAPQSPQAFLLLGLAQGAGKQFNAERSSLQQALKLKPDFLPAQQTLIQLEVSEKRYEAALAIARKVQAQDPKSATGFDFEGDILLVQKEYSPATKAFEKALTLNGSTAELIKLHRAYLLAGNTHEADQHLGDWIKQNPQDVTALSYAGDYYSGSGRNHEAISMYERALKIAPKNLLALNNLAGLYHLEKDSRALSTAEKALKLAPDNANVMDTVGTILLDQDQLARATELLGKAAAASPGNPSIRYHYAQALVRAGKKVEAKKELQSAVSSGQSFPELEAAKTLLKNM